jgi:biopolymer transport protein ExbB/biopolymer transport protein TolQ
MTTEKQIMQVTKRSMGCAVNERHEELKRGLNGLATIGSTAPFVGLFGTVLGIINSFRGFGVVRVAAMSTAAGGISEALITTGLGLFVAVPAVWAYNYFSIRLELFDIEMDHSVDAISTYLAGLQAAKRNQ